MCLFALRARSVVSAFVLLFPFCLFVGGTYQIHGQAVGPKAKAPASASDSIPLTGESDVHGNVTVEAGLLPYSVSRRIFGKEIAKHYAIVQLVISNHDAGDAMIIQSVFLDYTHWLFSGSFAAFAPPPSSVDGLTPFQASNLPYQVASTEARLVRSDLQDAQQWTARNWTVRTAVLVGATAVGYQFLFGQDFARGSNAFSGALIPGLQQLWPDNLQTQINHISDFGFGTNHVIPKNSSDVVVAFFPLDRFLTPDLQDVFRRAPSAFFNPSEMLLDSTYSTVLLNMLRRAGALSHDVVPERPKHCWNKAPGRCWVLTDDQTGNNKADAKRVSDAIMRYEQFRLSHSTPADISKRADADSKRVDDMADACKAAPTDNPPTNFNSNDCLILTLLDKVSLNKIRVVASGIMTVDTRKVPSTITAIQFASEPTAASTWEGPATTGSQAPQHTATLLGTFLAGGTPALAATDKDDKVLSEPPLAMLTVDYLRSDDNHLAFTYTLPAKVPPGTKLSFIVSKRAKDATQVQSGPLLYQVQYSETATPTDTSGKDKAGKAAPVSATAGTPETGGTTKGAASAAQTVKPAPAHKKGNGKQQPSSLPSPK